MKFRKVFISIIILVVCSFVLAACELPSYNEDSSMPVIESPHDDEGFLMPDASLYTVTFDMQAPVTPVGQAGWTFQISPITNIKSGSTIQEPYAPRKQYYYFAGWYRESEIINRWNFEQDVVTANITLYARWSDEVTVLSDGNGSIVLHENVEWHLYANHPINNAWGCGDSFFEAVPAPGFYFERWIYLDKNGHEYNPPYEYDGDYGVRRVNFFSKRDLVLGKDINNVHGLKAIFTNDEAKLVDTVPSNLSVHKTGNASVTVYGYAEKKVQGTSLVARAIADEGTSIELVTNVVGYNILIRHNSPTTWFLWSDLFMTTSTFGTADNMHIFISKI